MNPIGITSPHPPAQRPLSSTAAGGAGRVWAARHDPAEAKAAVERALDEMGHAYNLAPCERQALAELLAWHELARELYPCADAPDALLRPPNGPETEPHLARSVHLALERARRAAGAEATATVAPPSAPTPREVAIASSCARLLAEQWGSQAYKGMVSDWADAPRSESFPTVPELLLEMALCNADLRGKDLRWRDLSSLCLVGADLSGSRIEGASFKGADLSGATLQEVTAPFRNVDFTGANLQGANLSGSNCEADYTNANLRHAILSKVQGFVNLDGADLTGADLSTCRWHLLSTKGAILREATLPSSPFSMRDWTWSHMDLKDARAPARLTEDELGDLEHERIRDLWLNHVENQSRSCLSNLRGILDEGLRVQMMSVLVEGLAQVAAKGVALNSNHVSLCDGLLRDAAYLDEPRIRDFVDTHLGPVLLDQATGGQLPWTAGEDARRALDHPVAIAYGLQLVYEALPADDETPAEACAALARLSAPVNQLLAAARRHPTCAEVAQALRQAWVEQLYRLHPGLRAAMETESLEPREAGTYVEVSRDGQQVLAYEQAYMDRLEGRNRPELVSWSRAYRFEAQPEGTWVFADGGVGVGRAMMEDLRPFPWIQMRYTALNSNEAQATLLLRTALGVRDTPEGDHQMLLDFMARAAQSKSQPKTAPRPWLTADGQAKLERIFAPLLQPADTADGRLVSASAHTRFTPAHERTMLDHLQQGFGVTEPSTQARYVLALAQLFTYASSSAIMGTHNDSPDAPRAAGVACLNLVHELDPTLLAKPADGRQVSVHQDWVERLTGTQFSCTAILASAMSRFVHAHPGDTALAQAHVKVLPEAWR